MSRSRDPEFRGYNLVDSVTSSSVETVTETLGAFALLAWLAYLVSRLLARRHLPELVGFLIVGALLGPSGVELISDQELASLRPLTEVALAILMFVIG